MSTLVHELDVPTTSGDRSTPLTLTELADLRDQHWLIRTPLGYMLPHRDDTVAILKDARWHQASRLLTDLADIDDEEFLERQKERRISILSAEGDEHQRLRRLVSPAFTPRSADRLRPFMREVVNRLVDPVAKTGRTEFVADVCEPYPIPIVCELLGAPKEDWPLFSRWATDIFKGFNADIGQHTKAIMAASDELDAYVEQLIAERRLDPRDDLLSDLIDAEEAGDTLTTDELTMLAEAVLLAGTDTTRNQLACALALFAQHPDQWQLLGDQPELAPRAAEETMRFLGAVKGTGRFSSVDIEYRDVVFPAGTIVFPSFVGANTDPAHVSEPERFDITAKRDTPHLTLGFGLHYCLGANLARAELQEALIVLSQRFRNLELDGPVQYKPATAGIWGPTVLPLRFTPES